MSLTQIQRDAMSRAQKGNWSLADAIEIHARCRDGVCGGYRHGGRLALLVEGEPAVCDCDHCEMGLVECAACKGEKTLDCQACNGEGDLADGSACAACADGGVECNDCTGEGTVECDWCDGDGTFASPGCFDHIERVTNLNGDVIWTPRSDLDQPDLDGQYIDADWGAKIEARYVAGLAAAAEEKRQRQRAVSRELAQVNAAGLPASNQTTLIPENV